MRLDDIMRFSTRSLRAYPSRTALILLAMAIGITSVILLTSLGEGARQYVVGQFKGLGSNLLFVLPGKSETTGGMPPMMGTSPRDLTIDDALALKRSPVVAFAAPLVLGAAPVSYGSREREVSVLGSTQDLEKVLELKMTDGKFLDTNGERSAAAVCVMGEKLYHELFDNQNALGKRVHIGNYRFQVIGIVSSKAQSIGMDMSDSIIIPVTNAQAMFDQPSLFRIFVKATSQETMEAAKSDVLRIISSRHEGDEDITVISQDSLIGTFDNILKILTWALAGIAAISLLVAGILIMNVMLVAVSQRRAEIGLLKALGAPTRQVMTLFLSEALLLSVVGGLIGLAVGLSSAWILDSQLPDFPIRTPLWAIVASMVVTFLTGLLFGSIPARQAARLDPVIALSGKAN